ncbi:MAG: sigma-54 dependent transcriptional regulator [Acidobacteriota bacterium]
MVDDEDDILSSLRMILEYEGYQFIAARNGMEGLERVKENPDLILLDIKMPRMDGMEVLTQLRRSHPLIPVVMISGHGTIAAAVEATKIGAYDFMEKPLERERVLLIIKHAIQQKRLKEENITLKKHEENRFRMIGESGAMKRLKEDIAKVAGTNATVLITGESGTGKELVARTIHRQSSRQDRDFIKVNCAAIPEELIESELFGHEKGAFTGAHREQIGKFVQADGGTIFLDEVGDMTLKTQSKVLRVLQDGEVEPVGSARSFNVDVRVIAATNKDLPREIEKGTFREDLYFRLNVVPIHCPPLRERSDDIPPLVNYFMENFCSENNYKVKEITQEAMKALMELPWRGNIRELKSSIERLIIMKTRNVIDADDITEEILIKTAPERLSLESAKTLKDFKDVSERAFLVAKLRENNWNIARTAKEIGMQRSNLYKKMEIYGISREKDR